MNEIIKPIIKVGNSAGVLLPKEWLNGKAKVELISRPIDIKNEILGILGSYLANIKGIYLVGSHARGEETDESDIDVLAVTDGIDKKISSGKYSIILISEENLKKTLERNVLPLLPMIREAKPIINKKLLEQYKKIEPNKKNVKIILEITESSRKVCKEAIKMSKELNESMSDEIMYSLILGLRTVYILDCLKKNKIPTTKGIRELSREITQTDESYNAYLRSKNGKKTKSVIIPEIAEKLNKYILDKI
ncbi:MAG: nucleotidyltransferase domain-containing protein [Nanoarchaeota archaeon]